MVRMHVVFSAECNALFDWHSVGIFYSFELSNFTRTANLTRLLACSDEERKVYPEENLHIGRTFVHRNLRNDPLVDETGYPSYNKPYSVLAWLASERSLEKMSAEEAAEDEYVLMTDADMLFRTPIDPIAYGMARGVVVSAEYTYLVGTTTGFAERFIARDLVPRLAQVGGFHIFHREDLRLIAPKWLEYTKQVRAFAAAEPETFYRESMAPVAPDDEPQRAVRQKQSRWHSEMYGYVFAAAEVGVTHRVRRDVMLYPGYQPFLGRGPHILHYGSDFTVKGIYFNKMSHTELRVETCPAVLFGAPSSVDWAPVTKRDALCLEHLATLDAALCAYYTTKCDQAHWPAACGRDGEAGFRALARASHAVMQRCEDADEHCGLWANGGECARNPSFMHSTCALSCGSCQRDMEALLRTFGDDAYYLGDWKWKAGRHAGGGHGGQASSSPLPPQLQLPLPPPSPPAIAYDDAAVVLDAAVASGPYQQQVGIAESSIGVATHAEEHRVAWSQDGGLGDAEMPSPPPSLSPSPPPNPPLPPPSPLRSPPNPWAMANGGGGASDGLVAHEGARCVDEMPAAYCRLYVGAGKCARSLETSRANCRRSCDICHPEEEALVRRHDQHGRGGGSAGKDAMADEGNGEGGSMRHSESYGEMPADSSSSHMMLLSGGVVALGACVLRAMRLGPWRKPEKLEAKCAV